ncbi:hypothetical protein B0J18DRAFT_19628 [Chaetomium sp. MPI-SDFR-AT-0129]|nr:hypothetical protein B0J18DRAFT_19628 [Chaetomium sp. MPI-SDFR-AT-0129]
MEAATKPDLTLRLDEPLGRQGSPPHIWPVHTPLTNLVAAVAAHSRQVVALQVPSFSLNTPAARSNHGAPPYLELASLQDSRQQDHAMRPPHRRASCQTPFRFSRCMSRRRSRCIGWSLTICSISCLCGPRSSTDPYSCIHSRQGGKKRLSTSHSNLNAPPLNYLASTCQSGTQGFARFPSPSPCASVELGSLLDDLILASQNHLSKDFGGLTRPPCMRPTGQSCNVLHPFRLGAVGGSAGWRARPSWRSMSGSE